MSYREDTIFVRYLREAAYIPSWPVDEYGDLIDTENLIVIKVSESGVEFCCGGDWQDPMRLLLTPDLSVEVVDGPTSFGEIEIDTESLSRLEAWQEKNASPI